MYSLPVLFKNKAIKTHHTLVKLEFDIFGLLKIHVVIIGRKDRNDELMLT